MAHEVRRQGQTLVRAAAAHGDQEGVVGLEVVPRDLHTAHEGEEAPAFVLTQSVSLPNNNNLLATFRGLVLEVLDCIEAYRNRSSQPTTRSKALDEIYQIYMCPSEEKKRI